MSYLEFLNKKFLYISCRARLLGAVAAFLLLPVSGFAQFDMGSMNTAMDMNDTLNAGASGPSGQVVGQVQNDLSGGYPDTGYADSGYGDSMMVDPTIPLWTPPPFPDTFLARDGQRVLDAVNPLLVLDDVVYRQITQEQIDAGEFKRVGQFYDRIEPENGHQYVGGRTFHYMRRSINMLTAAHAMDILDFFGLIAMSVDPFSTLPNLRTKITERDDKIRHRDGTDFTGWANTFLRPYRTDPDSTDVEKETAFYELYIPRPPAPPGVPAPPSPWRPPFCDKEVARLERAVSAYLDQKVNQAPEIPMDMGNGVAPVKTAADLEKERIALRATEEALVRAQLKDAQFKAGFLLQYAPEQGGVDGGGYGDGGYGGYGGDGGGYPDSGGGGYSDIPSNGGS